MLLWGLAAAAPILIHLLSRRRYREAPWAAMEYLLAAVRKQSRRLRVEQWLLLAVRMLVLVAVAVALAEPYFEQHVAVAPQDERTHRVIVLDTSYSMATRSGASDRFDVAKKKLTQYLDRAARPGDAASLVVVASPPLAIVRRPTTDRDEFAAELLRTPQSHGGGDLAGALRIATEILKDAQAAQPPWTRHEVLVVSDLSRTSWQPNGRLEAGWEALAAAREAGQAPVQATILDVGDSASRNAAVTDVSILDPLLVAQRDVAVQATVKSFSDEPLGPATVELLVDGLHVGQNEISLDRPREQRAIIFRHRFTTPDEHELEVRISSDADVLPLDNRRWLIADVPPRVRVLAVRGRPGAANYLPLAFEPQPPQHAVVETSVADRAVLSGTADLSAYDVIALCNLDRILPAEAQRLAAHLRRGGGVMVFLGDQTALEEFSRYAAADAKPRLLPASVAAMAPSGEYELDPLLYRHPIVKEFENSPEAGLLSAPVDRYFRLKPITGGAARIALAIRPRGGGAAEPMIVEEKLLGGRVVLFATDPSRSSVDPQTKEAWTNWAVTASFLPIMKESLKVALGERSRRRAALVGETLGDELPVGQATVTVTRPNSSQPEPVTTQGAQWQFDGTTQAGIYSVALAADRMQRFAVNLHTAESDLTRIPTSDLPSDWEHVTDIGPAIGPGGMEIPARSVVSTMLLFGVLGLLLCETLLAALFGRRDR
jgi:Mg-chelatase subunit ChlD